MELRYYAGRDTPEPPPAVTHRAIGEFIRQSQSFLNQKAARGQQFSAVWDISGPGGGGWTAHRIDGAVTVHDGADPNADLTLRMSLLTFSLFWNGQFSLADAVDSGRICVDNIDALATFSTIFHLPDLDAGSP